MLDSVVVWKYLGVFLALLAAGFGAPIPEEIPVITAGGLVAGSDDLKWWIMLPLCIIGIVLADTTLYMIGRFGGSRLLRNGWVQRRLLPPAKRERIERNFEEYGIGILLFARLLPGIRSPIFIMAGVIRLPWWKFILADSIYAIPGVSLIFWLAYFFTDQARSAFEKFEEARETFVLLLLVAAIIAGIYFYIRQRRVATGDPSDFPIAGKHVSEWMHHHHHPELRSMPESGGGPDPLTIEGKIQDTGTGDELSGKEDRERSES